MKLTDDLTDPRWILVKGFLFLLLAVIAAVGILLTSPTWTTAALLAVGLWAACRWYYFMFYVIEHYVDPQFKFAGLGSFVRYLMRRRDQ